MSVRFVFAKVFLRGNLNCDSNQCLAGNFSTIVSNISIVSSNFTILWSYSSGKKIKRTLKVEKESGVK